MPRHKFVGSFVFKFLVLLLVTTTTFACEPEDVLSFWFDKKEYDPQRDHLWFGGDNPAFDQEIKDRFEGAVLAASLGDLDHWKKTPESRLALIILLDQFPRNMYRGSDKAYGFDSIAVKVTLEGISQGDDEQLSLIERVFFYLPLEHSENLEHQHLSVAKFHELARLDPRFESYLYYAIEHSKDIIEFGHFVRW